MARVNAPLLTLNQGEYGSLLSSRLDIQTYQSAAHKLINWLPVPQGPIKRRPSMLFAEEVPDSAKKAFLMPVIVNRGTSYMGVWQEGDLHFLYLNSYLDVPAVTASIAAFSSWTDESDGSSTATESGGVLTLATSATSESAAEYEMTVNEADTVHVFQFTVTRGPVNLRIGSISGGNDIRQALTLDDGIHQIAFDPGAESSVFIQFYHKDYSSTRKIESPSIMSAGDYSIAHNYTEAELAEIHTLQQGDTIYVAHRNHPVRVLERRGFRSFSLVDFVTNDGPWDDFNTESIRITPNATLGTVTLTASDNAFVANDVGALIELTQSGQNAETSATATEDATEPVLISGADVYSRLFEFEISGTWVGEVWLERSYGTPDAYTKWIGYTTNVSTSHHDGNRTDLLYVRLRVEAYTSGTIELRVSYTGGQTIAAARIVTVTNSQSAVVETRGKAFGEAGQATSIWRKSSWRANVGYPNAVTLSNSRLWFGRDQTLWLSAVDDFKDFGQGEDDAEAVSRTIATASQEGITGLAALADVFVGSREREFIAQSSQFGEPITPSNLNTRPQSDYGSSTIQPIVLNSAVLYLQGSRTRLMEFAYNFEAGYNGGYVSVDLTRLNPQATEVGVSRMFPVSQPEPRVFLVMDNGICRILTYQRSERLVGWATLETNGMIEDGKGLPEEDGDRAYFVTKRYLEGGTKRYIEYMEPESIRRDTRVGHVDSAVYSDLTFPSIRIQFAVGASTITVTADEDAFTAGDVGDRIYVAGGVLTITTFTNAKTVVCTESSPLEDYDPKRYGEWGIGTPFTTVSGLDHLEGDTVTAYYDGKEYTGLTVSSGQVTLPSPVCYGSCGVPYSSTLSSLKLAYGGQSGTALLQPKALKGVSFVFEAAGAYLYMGPTLAKLTKYVIRKSDSVYEFGPSIFRGEQPFSFPGGFETDPRFNVVVDSAAPFTISAMVLSIEEHDRP